MLTSPRTAIVIPQGTEEINGAGKFIIPALIDVYMRAGAAVSIQAEGQTFPAGVLTAQTSTQEARHQIDQFVAARRYMAVLDGLLPEVEDAALEESRKNPAQPLPVFARVSKLADARRLVAGGVAGFIGMITDTEEIDRAFIAKVRDLRIIWAPALVEQQGAGLAVARRNTMRLAAGGVLIAVGGAPIEREMELLVEAGLAPGDAIVAATRNGALALRRSLDLGGIQFGKRADLVVLSANPLEDVRNVRAVERVMVNGAWVK